MQRREFFRLLGLAAAGATLRAGESAAQAADRLYEVPPFGNVSLLHITDTHAQLLPVYFREPQGRKSPSNERSTYAFTSSNFETLARRYGKLGGFAHIATLVKRLRALRPHALLLDGGDSWQGSATALWTRGADMIGAQKLLGVDCMTGHWEFTYGAARLEQALAREAAPIEFLAQNVRTADFEDPVFKPYVVRVLNGVPVALLGQAYPYTPIANPRHFVPDWTFGIQEGRLQKQIDEARAAGAKAVVLLSHNGLQIDVKLASRVRGLDAILGGHTHDAMAEPLVVGKTLVTNAGCSGKFVSLLDLEVGAGGVTGYRHRMLPVFSNLLSRDVEMSAYIAKVRAPFEERLGERLAVTEGLLYRRGTFNGTFDELILEALRSEKDAEIAFSPGFRWGTTLLPGDAISFEHLMDQTAITYPHVTLNELTGVQIKAVLEDLADNLFNADPYSQQGGDMVRVGGMSYAISPKRPAGSRISEMRLNGRLVQADRRYKVAGWAPVAEGARGEAVWEVVARHLRGRSHVPPQKANRPIILS